MVKNMVKNMIKRGMMTVIACFAVMTALLCGCQNKNETDKAMPIKVLILPKFEVGEMSADFPGEAQYYYKEFLEGGEEYEVAGGAEGYKLYVKDGVAMYLTGYGKSNAVAGTMAVLGDKRFDFSEAYVFSTGCAGGAKGYTTMGDVCIVTTAIDYDLGHHIDSRELTDESDVTWFHDGDFDDTAVIELNSELTDTIYEMVRDIPLETTEKTRKYMEKSFDGAEWAVRDPMVIRGSTVTGDNYWKGEYGHRKAEKMMETYGCSDPFAVSEMEDAAIGLAVSRFGMEDRYFIIRDVVNMDVFMMGATPESLWGSGDGSEDSLASEDSEEAYDIFEKAMENNFRVGSTVIRAILDGEI